MFGNGSESPDPGLGTEEDREIMRQEAREGAEVAAAQREEERKQKEKEEGEMLRALMGDYQVEELMAAATEGRAAKRKTKGRDMGKPNFPQVGTGSRVQKREKESDADFFRRNRKQAAGRKEKDPEAMEMEEKEGELAELFRTMAGAFEEKETGGAKTAEARRAKLN